MSGPRLSRRSLQACAEALRRSALARYLFAVMMIAGAFAIRLWLTPLTGTGAPFVLFFAAVLVTSLLGGLGPGLCVVALSMPLAAHVFVVRAGYPPFQAVFQALLFAVDGLLVVYLTHLLGRRRGALLAANQQLVEESAERKRIADERQVFVSLLDNATDFIGIADPGGRPIYLNPAGRQMVGLAADFPVEQTQILEYYPPEERAFAEEIVKSIVERGRWSGETHFRNWRTGEPIPVSSEHFLVRDPSGERVLGTGTVTRDISEAQRITGEREELLARERRAREQAEAANERLRESEERFRLALDEAPIGMALVALDGRFVRVNRALCEIVGYGPAELLGLTFQAITHPDDLDTDLALLERLTRGEIPRYQLEKRYFRKDGTIVPVLLTVSVLRDPLGKALYYIGQVQDITERKRAEAALRDSEAKFSGIISISADGIVSIDDERRITIFNEGAEKIFGYSRAEAIGAPLDILLPERSRAAHVRHIQRFAAGEVTARRMGERLTTIMGRRKSGEEFPAEAAISKLEVGGRTLLTVALRDVTERIRAEQEQRFLAEAGAALAASLDFEQTLATVAQLAVRELADWCVVEVMGAEGQLRRLKVASASPAGAALCAELEQAPLDRERPYLLRRAVEARRSVLLREVTTQQLDGLAQGPEHLRMLRALGARSLMAVPLLARGQLLGGLVLISSAPSREYGQRDLRVAEALADRAAAAIENARLYRAAVQATQFRDQVLGIVAHDLRNPLTTISLQLAMMRRRGPEPERRSLKPHEGVQRAVTRMNRLIQDLLDVARMENGNLHVASARLSAAGLLAEALDAQRANAAAAGIELRPAEEHELPEIWGDRDRLLQVFENLIGNALKFSTEGGVVTIGAASAGGEVVFRVADTGCGIAPENLPRIFDRFWQAEKTDRRGAGLGLPIVKGIVKAHGGRIWVESTLGRGTTFFFSIPQAQGSPPGTGDGRGAAQ